MRKTFILFILFSIFAFSQEKKSLKLGAFGSLEANIGLDLKEIIRRNNATNDYEKYNEPPGKFNYGFSANAGFQPLKWFAVSGGLRYSYVDPNYHLIYATAQPYFILNNPEDREFVYIFANIGQQINKTAAEKSGFLGLGIGKIEPINERLGQKFQIYLDDQVIAGEANVFIGISYGIVIFSNKNL